MTRSELSPGEFAIEIDGEVITASDGVRSITVEPGDKPLWYRHRTNITRAIGANGRDAIGRWFIVEVDGVRLYINGNHMIMTKRDLYFEGA